MNQYTVCPETPSEGGDLRCQAFSDSGGTARMVREAIKHAAERRANMIIEAPHWSDGARVVVRPGAADRDVIGEIARLDRGA